MQSVHIKRASESMYYMYYTTGCSFAIDTFKIVIKSSFFVQNLRTTGHLKAKTWGFAIHKKNLKNVIIGNEKSAEIRRVIFQLTRLSSQLAPY